MSRNLYRFSLIVLSIFFLLFQVNRVYAQGKDEIAPFKQYFFVQPSIGFTQYYGDYNQKDFSNDKIGFGFGANVGYQISPVFGLRAAFDQLHLVSVRADQGKKLSSNLMDNSLHLTININEIFAEYNSKRFLNFYVFSGAGFTLYKSKVTEISTGNIHDQNNSLKGVFALPVGAGASFRINEYLSFNLEYCDHIVFDGTKIDLNNYIKNNDHYSYTSAGMQFNIGMKDTDGDGVRDKDDLCPETPGKIKLAGCPDKDNDGVADKDDACPEVAGKTEFNGCPDTDGDGIIDSQDACPSAAGSLALNGCPDQDGDGIADKDDKCPDVAGLKELGGCPDRDGDGIADKDDVCPDVKGLAQFNGCPDTDGDGIADNVDKCPDVFGIASNEGCPEVKFEYFKVVYFNFDKSVLITKFVKDLDEVVTVMNEHPTLNLSVEGYADSKGPAAYNLKLSEKRADYVIHYLTKKGIAKERLVKSYFGEKNPAASNRTLEGRSKNRRVEIKSIK